MTMISTTATTTTRRNTFGIYPLSQLQQLKEQHDNVKVIHIIRHAEGTHNVGDYKDPANLDARLTEKGVEQCQAFVEECARAPEASTLWDLQQHIDLVVTSTMSRCIETALQSFPSLVQKKDVAFIGHEGLRETVNYVCDRRRSLEELEEDFPRIDFAGCPQEDEIWKFYENRLGVDYDKHRESAELWRVVERGREFFEWLAKRSEQQVVLCTHSAFLRCILSWGQTGGVAMQLPQVLDEREDKTYEPVVTYHGDESFEEYVRADYANCELRSFVMVF